MAQSTSGHTAHRYGRRVVARLALALASALLALSTLVVPTGTAAALAAEAPTVGTPAITATSAASVQVSVSVDSHGSETTVKVEYATAGAYRGTTSRVPSAATTVVIATTPASGAGPVTVTGQVAGLAPDSTYRMRVKASNVGGETISTDVTVKTPRAPKISFKAKVGKDTTTLTKLVISGLLGVGAETVRIRCRTLAKGCPFTAETDSGVAVRVLKLKGFKGHALKPNAKVSIRVLAANTKVAALTLIIRDDEQPKVKRK
jgi:hypothetical protein